MRECDAMLRHASSKGIPVSSVMVRDYTKIANSKEQLGKIKCKGNGFVSAQNIDFSEMDMGMLTNIHSELARSVAPATPFTLLFVDTDAQNSNGSFRIFGSVPMVRRLLLMAIFCLLVLLSFAFIPDAPEIIGGPLLQNESFNLILAVVFRLAAAGMGASFFALYKAKGYVSNYTFDPTYEVTYWTEFGLGLMAGLIFSTLLDGQGSAVSETLSADSAASGVMLGKITLALLGGFSSTVVYEFLNKTVQALASIFKADPKKIIDAEVRNVRANIENSFAKKRQTVLNHLSDFQSDIFTGDFSKEGMNDRLRNLIDDLTDGEDKGYIPQDGGKKRPNIPKNIPGANDINTNIEDIDPMSVAFVHEDDLLEATEDEYVEIFDTRA